MPPSEVPVAYVQVSRKEFEQAKSEGRKAALVEQQRPNVFTTSVSSVMPDEDAVIEIAYQEMARYENGEYRLRFPMVVAPRYNPAHTFATAVAAKLPFTPSGGNNNGGTIALSVDLQPGYSVRNIVSAQQMKSETIGNRHYRVTADSAILTSGQDFELSWQPDLGTNPEATVLTEKLGEETYALVMVTPPAPAKRPPPPAAAIDVTFSELAAYNSYYRRGDAKLTGDAKRPYREDDPPSPLSVYGRTKADAESAAGAFAA